SIRDFNITNEAVLGGLFDDNSEPITILRASLGTVTGGPVAQKDFPTPGDNSLGLPLVDNAYLEIPSEPHGPLYRWWNYNQMNDPATPVQLNNAGQPYTSAKSEVTDLHQMARGIFEAPADYTEQYFPTRLLTDLEAAANGDRSGNLANLAHDGVAQRPG